MAVTEVFPASMTFTTSLGVSAAGGATNGTWVWQAGTAQGGSDDVSAGPNASGGGAMRSSNGGDTMTYALPAGTRAAYMLGVGSHSNCDMELYLSTDGGVTYVDYGRVTSLTATFSVAAQLWRYGRILARGLDPAVNYTLKLVVVSGQSAVYINSLILVSGPRIVPTANVYDGFGDSWMAGQGASASNIKGFGAQFAQMLRAAIPVASMPAGFTFNNYGVSGDCLYGTGSVASGKLGAFYRLFQRLNGGTFGAWFSLQFGPNDLGINGVSAGEFGRNIVVCLSLIEDCVDVSKMAGALIGTPGYISPGMHVQYQQGFDWSSVTWIGDVSSNYELGVDAVYSAVAPFPWATVVPVYEGMDERADLVDPNSAGNYNGDFGLHLSDGGHTWVALIYYGSAKGILLNPIAQGGRVLAAR